MWLTVWLACSQEASIESKTAEPNVVPKQVLPSEKEIEERESNIEGVLYFAKSPECSADCIESVKRQVPSWTPQIALDSLYQGPSKEETGLRFIGCGSSGAKLQAVESGVAKVQLEGDCGGCGSLSVYDLIVPTLKAFHEINVVQLYDSSGKSQIEGAQIDSRPACLEP